MKNTKLISCFIALTISLSVFSQDYSAEYTRVLTERSAKIVNTLGIDNQKIADRVTNILVEQYRNIGYIHDSLPADVRQQKLYALHAEFIGKLTAEISQDQIEKIKDGMTYGVLKVTYDSYCDMIPSLKDDEKRQLIAWLAEARELAMDAPSSNKKHEVFGKYKGRFNNYLSQRGYDSTKERQNWEERQKNSKQEKAKSLNDFERKATEMLQPLNLTDQAKQQRLVKAISEHLQTVRDWHNAHPHSVVPEGINPRTGDALSKVDRQIIVDATLPKDVHQKLMTTLRNELSEEQIEVILDKYTIGKVDFTMKAYREIIKKMTKEEETTILNYLKQAREQAIDYKNMDEISAIFKIYKTKIELYLYQNGRNWKKIYKEYVDSNKKK